MKCSIIVILGLIALSTSSTPPPVDPHEAPTNCTKVDKAAIQKQVSDALVKAVQLLFEGPNLNRKRRDSTPCAAGSSCNANAKSEVHDEQTPLRMDSIHPVEMHRHHYRLNRFKDSNIQPLTVNGAGIGTTVSRSRTKRFCIPMSYDNSVKLMIQKVVAEAFTYVKF